MKNLAEQGREPTHEWRFVWDSNPSHIAFKHALYLGESRGVLSVPPLWLHCHLQPNGSPDGQSKQTFVFPRLKAETVLFCIDLIYTF